MGDIEAVFDNYKGLLWPEQTAIGDLIYQYTRVIPQGILMAQYKNNPALERERDVSKMLPGIRILKQRYINAFYVPMDKPYAWRSGDFICHFAGNYHSKLKLMTRLFDCMESQNGDTSGCEYDGSCSSVTTP